MPFEPDADYWLEIPADRYTVGVTPEDARALARESAKWIKDKGVDLSPNVGKMMMRAAVMLDTTGNPGWVEQYLLDTYPARAIELPAFSIARRPVTNREYRQFMADTGETQEPESWERDPGNAADELPARGLSWWSAVAVAEWARARLPFGDEWERSVRGTDRRLFPWGNEFGPIGAAVDARGYEYSLPSAISVGPGGIEGALTRSEEWCAELFPGKDVVRLAAGASGSRNIVPAGVCRTEGTYGSEHETACVRLVRADGRLIEPPAPTTPQRSLAIGVIRPFESRVLRPLIADLAQGPIGELHNVRTSIYHAVRGAGATIAAAKGDGNGETELVPGLSFVAESRESIRRIPVEHGLFAWMIQYRIDELGDVRARPVVAFHMAFDKGMHRFENRFRPDEPDTRLAELTADLIMRSILDAFQFYELHADSDQSPFR